MKIAIQPYTRTAFVESNSTMVGETDTRQPSLCNKLHVCRWNRSHVRGHVKLVRAASSHNTAESRKTKEGSNLNINAHKLLCVLLVIASTQRPSSDTTVGERCMGNKNFPMLTKINLGDASTRGELDPHTFVDR